VHAVARRAHSVHRRIEIGLHVDQQGRPVRVADLSRRVISEKGHRGCVRREPQV
jgi:hypothetical protein